MKLTEINGVGPATEADLIEAGYEEVEDLPTDKETLEALDFNEEEIAHIFELQAQIERGQADMATDTAERETQEALAAEAKAAEAQAALTEGESETNQTTSGELAEGETLTGAGQPEPLEPTLEQPQSETPVVETAPVPNTQAESAAAASPTLDEDSQDAEQPNEDEQPPVLSGVIETTDTPTGLTDAPLTEQEQAVEGVEFKLISGPHKGRTLKWSVGTVAGIFTDGAYASLDTIQVVPKAEEFQTDEDEVAFIFIWGNSRSGAVLSADEYAVFSAAVKKKSKPVAGLPVL